MTPLLLDKRPHAMTARLSIARMDYAARVHRSCSPPRVHETRTIGAVPRATEHSGIARFERCAAIDQRVNVVKRHVVGWVGRMVGTIAWADPSELPDVARDHALT